MITPEQFATTHKANVETLFSLSNKALEGFEKFFELNFNAAKATQAELADKMKELFSLRDPQEIAQFGISLAQPTAEKALAYTRHVSDITKATQAEFVRVAEAQLAESNRKFATLIDSASKNAPTGSESAFAMLKSFIAASNSALDSAKKAGQQFVDVTEANFAAATNATVKAANQAASVSKINKKAA